jgi:hypothetical protein
VIFFYLWQYGMLRAADAEKLRFFLGATSNPLFLSRRWPLLTAVNWLRAVFSPSYARAVARWLRYRADLYDGLQG